GERVGAVSYETDRARFLGRGRTPQDPVALAVDGPLSETIGAVLDPIFALRVRVALEPGQSTAVAFTTLVATSRVLLFVLAHRYWRRRGMTVDLVVLNGRAHSYLQELSDLIASAMFTATDSAIIDRPGGVFVRRRDAVSEPDLAMLRATARLLVRCDGRSIGKILEEAVGPSDEAQRPLEPAATLPRASGRYTPAAVR